MSPWITPGQPALVLAPMDGLLDAPMRALLTKHGSYDYCVSEFVRVTSRAPAPEQFGCDIPELATKNKDPKHGPLTPAGTPVQIQVLGGQPETLAEAALNAVIEGARAIDLNFGCPAPTVNRHDGGATLLKYPQRLREIVSAVRKAAPPSIPVSAKMRLGWEDPDNVFENAEMLLQGGASWITLHGRTRVQGYRGEADWQRIGRLKKHLGDAIPIVANGDIRSLEDFQRCQDATRCEHFMIGRGALIDPWVTQKIRHWLAGTSFLEETPGFDFFANDFMQVAQEFSATREYTERRLKQWARLAQTALKQP